MSGISIFEFDALTASSPSCEGVDGLHSVPAEVYRWLEEQCLRRAEGGGATWLRLSQRRGRRAVQVTSFVGVIRAPGGFQIEVLPKVGRAIGGGRAEARGLLLEMLCCLRQFRHVRTASAQVAARRMPLLEVFIAEFLCSVQSVVKRGLRSDYTPRQDNLPAFRGKLLVAPHLRENLCRADRFFTEHDEFCADRPENRLLRAALERVLVLSGSQENQRLGRELHFVFAGVPASVQPAVDFQRVRLDRGMGYYADPLAWARLILEDESPLAGAGDVRSPSLLFPMEAIFEAYVAKHLPRQLGAEATLRTQACNQHLVRHQAQAWFRLKPDLLVRRAGQNAVVLDTKWKLLDSAAADRARKYGLGQGDFYQMHAYGRSYLNGCGDVVLIYPSTDTFNRPLPVFEFPSAPGLRLWVLPFCLRCKRLHLDGSGTLFEFLGA